jgi:hypothetical protein
MDSQGRQQASKRGGRLANACLVVSAIFAAAACTPFSWARPWGALVRRAEDVTPERYERFLGITIFLAVAWFVYGFWLRRTPTDHPDPRSFEPIDRRSSEPQRWPVLIGALILALGIGCRLRYLSVPMAYDEAYSFLNFAQFPWYIAIADYNNTNNHVFNTLLMHVSFQIWGQQEWALRTPALIFGIVLLATAFPWAKRRGGETGGLVTLAMIACSPRLIDYSVNARGYIYVTALAVLIDHCLDRLSYARTKRCTVCWTAWAAMVLGLWTMPIMVYPLVGILLGYLGEPVFALRRDRCKEALVRWRALAPFIGLGLLAVAMLYAPAYVFRGLQAARNPFVHGLSWSEWANRTPGAWSAAFDLWTSGPVPIWMWSVILGVGIVALSRRREKLIRVTMMFAATILLMTVHRVAPPPRLFLFLTPWVLLVFGAGLAAVLRFAARAVCFVWPRDRAARDSTSGNDDDRPVAQVEMAAIAVLLAWFLIAAVEQLAREPVLLDPEQRTDAIVAVPDAIDAIRQQPELQSGRHNILAALPCDKPAEYYAQKSGLAAEINGRPTSDMTVWLLVPRGEPSLGVLEDIVVQQPDLFARALPPQLRRDLGGLSVWMTKVSP